MSLELFKYPIKQTYLCRMLKRKIREAEKKKILWLCLFLYVSGISLSNKLKKCTSNLLSKSESTPKTSSGFKTSLFPSYRLTYLPFTKWKHGSTITKVITLCSRSTSPCEIFSLNSRPKSRALEVNICMKFE